MKKKLGFVSLIVTMIMTVYSIGDSISARVNSADSATKSPTSVMTESSSTPKTKADSKQTVEESAKVTNETTKQIDWKKPSEDKSYPELTIDDVMLVNTLENRVYIQRNDKTIYTMYCSAGSEETPTPKGDFAIENERGETFVNSVTGEGANFYVSFKDHGIYLFHTVPIDDNGEYIPSEAEKLGLEAASHGCVRLSVADAKWFYDNAVVGMKVTVI